MVRFNHLKDMTKDKISEFLTKEQIITATQKPSGGLVLPKPPLQM